MIVNAVLAWGSPQSWAVPWDVNIFGKAVTSLLGQVGIAFNIGIWAFLGITGIYLVLKFLDGLIH